MMKSFSLNSKKKKDIEKQKKLAEEEACAEAYEEFIATFETPKSQSKLFVRGTVINPNSGEELNAQNSGKLYKPDKFEELERKKSRDDSKNNNKHDDKYRQHQNRHHQHHHSSSSSSLLSSSSLSIHDKPAKKKSDQKKKSNLEIFKEELKMLQEEREERFRQRNKENNDNSSKSNSKSTSSSNNKSTNDDDDYDSSNSNSNSNTNTNNNNNNNNNNNHQLKKTGGSHDTGDPNTTNIYLGNLSPKMTETQLCEIFGRYGPLASVKIMWPRTEEERIRNRNCGFVAFMSRKDGERALKALNNRVYYDYEMRLGWGKTVTIPPTPIYIPEVLHELIMPPPQSGLPFNAQIQQEKDRELLKNYGNDPQKLFRENREAFDDLLSRTVVKVTIPQDRNLLCLIHRVVEFVVREGPPFEALLMNRELSNPQYSFLFENQSPAHVYYRWRLYSVLQGEHPSRWRTEDFRMFIGGSLWRPPPINIFQQGMPEELLPEEYHQIYNDDNNNNNDNDNQINKDDDDDDRSVSYSDDSDDSHHRRHRHSHHHQERHKHRENGKKSSSKSKKRRHKESSKTSSSSSSSTTKIYKLSNKNREKLEDMLRALCPQRSKIGDMMIFCIEHADSWEEIVECISESLYITETPLYKKIARLFLLSDILHNCSVKVSNASNYRKGFQLKLPEIFQSFNQAYNQIEGRLKAEQFKQRVMNCFRAWEDSAIYSSDFLIKLQNIFLGLTKSTTTAATTGTNATILKNKEIVNKSTFLLKQQNDDDIDGEPIIDEDIDGVEITTVDKNNQLNDDPFKNKFKTSKWETVDQDQESSTSSLSLTKIQSKWNKNLKDSYGGADDYSTNDDDDSNDNNNNTNLKDSNFLKDDDDDDIDGKPIDDDFFTTIKQQQDKKPNSIDNLPREVLRDIELKVIKYQDDIETDIRNGTKKLDLYETLEQIVERYRMDLMRKALFDQNNQINKISRSRSTKLSRYSPPKRRR